MADAVIEASKPMIEMLFSLRMVPMVFEKRLPIRRLWSYGTYRPKYSGATARGNIVPSHCFIDMFLLLLLRDLHGLTAPWEILFGNNIAENDYWRERWAEE
jgi:hypothetical protein